MKHGRGCGRIEGMDVGKLIIFNMYNEKKEGVMGR